MFKTFLRSVHQKAQQNEHSMRLLGILSRTGIPKKINSFYIAREDAALRKHPSDEMMESQMFFLENWPRAKRMLTWLKDERSKKCWAAAVRYRTMRTPIPTELVSSNNQYFVDEFIKIQEDEVFVDGGAYTGDTVRELVSRAAEAGVKIKRVIAFEPGEVNYNIITKNCKKYPFVQVIKKGLSGEDGVVDFLGSGTSGKVVSDEAEDGIRIHVTKIDNVPACQDATWIKMDIEGSEMDALFGAKEVIKRNHPKLTICIYHSDEDMIRIAEYVHELVPEYKLYIRHHTQTGNETVLYAV